MTIFLRVTVAAMALASTSGLAMAQDTAEAEAPVIMEMRQGNPDAAVTVIEYASYTCPHCANFHAESYPRLKADFIDTDQINFVYREVYFDRPGLWASIVARCGEGAENRFFGITEMLYDRADSWKVNDPAQVVEGLKIIGRTAGLSDSDLDACLTDADGAQALYAWSQENMEEDGVNSTPTFVINGDAVPNQAYGDLKAIIEDAIADAG